MKTLKVPTFHDVLDGANFWRMNPSVDNLRKAAGILESGLLEFPYALALGDELALVYQKLNEDKKAWDLLQRLKQTNGELSEETLARLAKIHKKLAYEKIHVDHLTGAVRDLEESERLYGESFEKRRGFYPRINQLTMRFQRASLLAKMGKAVEANGLVETTRRDAAAMLADHTLWVERQPEDAIWSSATRAEANVLLAEWDAAKAAYREAVRLAAGKRFYAEAMRDQILNNLVPTYQMLVLPFDPELADAIKFFQPEPETLS